MKLIFFLTMLLFSNWTLASQVNVLLGADFQWGAVFNPKFGAEICAATTDDCQTISAEGQAISIEQLSKTIETRPDFIENGLFRLRWGFFEQTECCGDSNELWLAVHVKLVASEVKSGFVRTVYFPDNTFVENLKCIEPNSVHKTNGLGLLYVDSLSFGMNRIISPKGAVGRPTGNFAVSCQK